MPAPSTMRMSWLGGQQDRLDVHMAQASLTQVSTSTRRAPAFGGGTHATTRNPPVVHMLPAILSPIQPQDGEAGQVGSILGMWALLAQL